MRLLRFVSVATILLNTLMLAQFTSLTSSPLVLKVAASTQPDPTTETKIAGEGNVYVTGLAVSDFPMPGVFQTICGANKGERS